MTAYDGITEVEADDECRAWLIKVLAAKEEIVSFMSGSLPGCPQGVFEECLKCSYNFCMSVSFDGGGPSAMIRFQKPGHMFTAQ
jgi:hypothetical protein